MLSLPCILSKANKFPVLIKNSIAEKLVSIKYFLPPCSPYPLKHTQNIITPCISRHYLQREFLSAGIKS